MEQKVGEETLEPLDMQIVKEHLKEDRLDPKEVEDSDLANVRMSEQHLPKHYLKRVQQVFHKYEQSRMREVAGLFS